MPIDPRMVAWDDSPKSPKIDPRMVSWDKEPTFGDAVKQGFVDYQMGGLRGAGSIGASLLWPVDALTDYIKGDCG